MGTVFPIRGDMATITAGAICYDDTTSTTLRLAGGGWSTLSPLASPSNRSFSALSSGLRTGNNFAFLFGGLDTLSLTPLLNDLWRFDVAAGTWQQLVPSGGGGPTPRFGAAMSPLNSPALQMLFGGWDSSGFRNDCWVFLVGLGWTQQAVPPGMVARNNLSMCPGPGNTIVVFGGQGSAGVLGDTWVWSSGSWSPVGGPGPTARQHAFMVFDPTRDMVVLHGGDDGTSTLNDDWEFNGFSWRQVGAAGAPTVMDAVGFAAASPPFSVAEVVGVTTISPTTSDTLRFTPSPAAFNVRDITCDAGGGDIMLRNVDLALPILNSTLAMQVTGLTPTTLLLGGFELTPVGGPVTFSFPTCPQCTQGLSYGPGTVTDFVSAGSGPGTGSWNLAIANAPALLGQGVMFQAVVVDAGTAHPCFVMLSNLCDAVVGL
jgi:hypothetical protein